jgi:pilus assembly protein FimV
MDSKAEAAPASVAAPAATKDDFESFDFDLTANEPNAFDVTESANSSIDNLDLDFDFDMPMGSTGESQQGHFGTPDLTEMDDFETKLDLANAYIEMGDPDAAKDIAEEVIRNGSVGQKKTAEAILKRLK